MATQLLQRSPFRVILGFGKLIDHLTKEAENNVLEPRKNSYSSVLHQLRYKEELIEGIEKESLTPGMIKDIRLLLSTIFPSALLSNEIKIATPPMDSMILQKTDRFTHIFGDLDSLDAKELEQYPEDVLYVTACTYILKMHYGIKVNITRPMIYDIRDEKGILKHYKSTYNGDFLAFYPADKAPEINEDLMLKLLSNMGDVDLWKSVFPPGSWVSKGFGIRSFTDVSIEESVSRFKNLLISRNDSMEDSNYEDEMHERLRTIFGIQDIVSCFTFYDNSRGEFRSIHEHKTCLALGNDASTSKQELLCTMGEKHIFEDHDVFVIGDVDKYARMADHVTLGANLQNRGIQSYMVAPLYEDDVLLGILEFGAATKDTFSSLTALRLEEILPMSQNAIKAYINEYRNRLTAVIQNECTAIHPSVAWKFNEEAEQFIKAVDHGEEAHFNNIVFHNLTALYGEVDIAGSSVLRNNAITEDLLTQVDQIRQILVAAAEDTSMPLLDHLMYQVQIIGEKLSSDLAAGMEQEVNEFFRQEIHPLFRELSHHSHSVKALIQAYFTRIHDTTEIVYEKRKDYDKTIEIVNQKLAAYIDKSQVDAQKIYPHYFERYKTDGIEHNMFIGSEISPEKPFNQLYINNLRLWQLKTLCEMEIFHHNYKPSLPVPVDVKSLIMVYSNPIAIQYRLDEKHFDVDGAYNARYEIIKKRIDKAYKKGTKERITSTGKITIVYTNQKDLEEYLSYINFLTYEGFFIGEPELFDIESLQGVSGLKGICVRVNYAHPLGSETKGIEDLTKRESAQSA